MRPSRNADIQSCRTLHRRQQSSIREPQNAGRAEVAIGDTGIGMTPEFVQNELFRPFASTKSNGMGIGSHESQTYVKELGGSIHVQSEPGRGTTLTVLLPLFEVQTQSDLHAREAG